MQKWGRPFEAGELRRFLYQMVKNGSEMIRQQVLQLGRYLLTKKARQRVLRHTQWPPVNQVQFGQLRRLQPISRNWGATRGKPIDRYYIEQFLATHADDIRGHVLEMGDNRYTLAFGGNRVAKSEVADVQNAKADYVIDLTYAPHMPSNRFDCIICIQTLQFIPDLDAGVSTLCRILKPGGVLLVTVPGISQLDPNWTDYWRFTPHSVDLLFNRFFQSELRIHTFGNVLSSTSFLHGISVEELSTKELDHQDDMYPLLMAVWAQKPLEQR